MFLDEKFITDKGFTNDFGYGVTFRAKSKTILNDYIVSGYDKKADRYYATHEGEWEIGQGYFLVDRIDLSYDNNTKNDITDTKEYKDFLYKDILYKVNFDSISGWGYRVLVIRDGHSLNVKLSLTYNDKVQKSEDENKILNAFVFDIMDNIL